MNNKFVVTFTLTAVLVGFLLARDVQGESPQPPDTGSRLGYVQRC